MHKADVARVVEEFKEGKGGTFGVSLADPECGEGQFPPFISQTPVTLSLVDQCGFEISNVLPSSFMTSFRSNFGVGRVQLSLVLPAFLALYSSPSA